MKRRSFLAAIAALLSFPKRSAATPSTPTIEDLELAYCKAANDLHDYRDAQGFSPGVRVKAHSRYSKKTLTGTIPPYGDIWRGNQSWGVPVILDEGYVQPWRLSDLTVIEPNPAP